MRHEPLLAIFVEIAEVLAAELHVLGQVIVAPVGDSLELADPERKGILDVGGRRRIERQLVGVMVAQPQPFRLEPQLDVPIESRLAPVSIPLPGLFGTAEKLDLHLLEFTRAKGEIAGIDLIAKALTDLCDSERNLDAARYRPRS